MRSAGGYAVHHPKHGLVCSFLLLGLGCTREQGGAVKLRPQCVWTWIGPIAGMDDPLHHLAQGVSARFPTGSNHFPLGTNKGLVADSWGPCKCPMPPWPVPTSIGTHLIPPPTSPAFCVEGVLLSYVFFTYLYQHSLMNFYFQNKSFTKF